MQTIVINIAGRVQGVFFRQGTREKALAFGITGSVRNLPNGAVQVRATGTKEQLDALVAWCRQGPPRAVVTGLEWEEESLQLFSGFKILR